MARKAVLRLHSARRHVVDIALAVCTQAAVVRGQPLPPTHVGPAPLPQGQAPNYSAVPPGGPAPLPTSPWSGPAAPPPIAPQKPAAPPDGPRPPVLAPVSGPEEAELEPPRLGGAGELDGRLDRLMAGGVGLRSEDVARMAYESAAEGLARRAEAKAADARVAQALIAYF